MIKARFEHKSSVRAFIFELRAFVKNIDDEATDEELRKHFSQRGTITSAKLLLDEKGINRGFGFVCFSTPEEPLYVAIAQRKEDRYAQLQLQYARQIAGLTGPSTSVIPRGYPPLYFTSPSGVVPQIPPRPGMIYQPLGMRGGWRANGFAPQTIPAFQASPLPIVSAHLLNDFIKPYFCYQLQFLNIFLYLGELLVSDYA
ncbi:hypothetical protein Ddye_008093 [Dipteronia dyeriana]|uniref:RRM domain-containing protein n=1 Tax=Dipteronia dyeriana TaxID=168575 RepID=A0AAD9X998_9ROSI|nr:hypothetical protein Ddye_008093 [Dipteronia dyeriana]